MCLGQKVTKPLFTIFLILTCTVMCSCGRKEPPPIEIGRGFYYWESTEDSTLGDALKNARNFKKLDDFSEHNLMHVFGKDKHFVWLRAEFIIPPYYRNASLAMVIPHLRFANQVYCNNVMIRQDGSFPPNERSTLFMAHFFSFPPNILNQEGKNTILIKAFVQGDSGISSHITIQPPEFSYPLYEKLNFTHSRIYMLLFGIMFFTFILYFILWANLRNFKEYLVFALLNLATAFFNIFLRHGNSGLHDRRDFSPYICKGNPLHPWIPVSLPYHAFRIIFLRRQISSPGQDHTKINSFGADHSDSVCDILQLPYKDFHSHDDSGGSPACNWHLRSHKAYYYGNLSQESAPAPDWSVTVFDWHCN